MVAIQDVEILDSVESHCEELIKTLRLDDKLEAIRIGLDPDTAILYSWSRGLYRKTGLINGKVAAIWGVMGTPMSFIGCPYLITGTEVTKISPIRFAKIYTKEVKQMKRLFPVLENYVDASYTGAVRMLRLAGFKLEGPVIVNNNDFYKFTMSNS